ncbi:Regulating synaptic membrane exocytosis protein 2 [Papilio machaon]|uniref:Regulating synaptic membrane exocytosis protein 2 n=1 Tax=Papilio machaon TaxID=76193 RepID=A0A0N0PEJ5_PAPMA|nr:Regulating synaptic membrane exocytosis protein 2 [Papilio machaon]
MRGSGSSDGGGLSDFIDGLGPGQLVGRQLLGAPTLGDVQLSMCYQKGFLEVEVIRARGLQARQGSRTLPAPYVKVYLVSGKKCIAKAKTSTARRTLDPLYQQTLTFRENFKGCILQVTVWGDYGRIEGKKVFMGVAQIMLDDLNLSNIVIGWYKLFGTTSLCSSCLGCLDGEAPGSRPSPARFTPVDFVSETYNIKFYVTFRFSIMNVTRIYIKLAFTRDSVRAE